MSVQRFRFQHAMLVAAVVAVITSLPYIACWALTEPDHVYLGLKAVNSADHLTYAAWMRQAADGNLWFRNLYSTESREADILLPFFWVLGRAAGLLNVDVILFQHLARAVFAFVLIVACWLFTGTFLSSGLRVRAFCLLALGTGLPGLIPEASPISAAHDSAIQAASWTLLLAAFAFFYLGMQKGGRWHLVISGVVAGVLAVIHPYDAIPLGTVMALATLLPVFPASLTERVIRAGWAAGPFLAGTWLTTNQFLGNPVLSDWAADPRPFSWWALLSFGALWIGVAAGVKETQRSHRFLWLWLVAGVILLAVPSPVARRLIQGLQAPLVILATLGFEEMIRCGWGRAARLSQATFYPAAVVMLLLDPSGILRAPVGLTVDQAADLRELETLPEGAILADPVLSYFIPPLSGRQVYCGNYSLTIDYERKAGYFGEVLRGDIRPAGLPVSILLAPIDWEPNHVELTPLRTFRTLRAFAVVGKPSGS